MSIFGPIVRSETPGQDVAGQPISVFLSTLLGARTPFLSSADGLDTRCLSRPYVGLAVAGP